MENIKTGSLFLKRDKSLYCYDDKRNYQFKETTNGRYFVWQSKYRGDEGEVNGLCASDELREKMGGGDLEKYWEQQGLNKRMGRCFEVGRTTYAHYLKDEIHTHEFLAGNTDPTDRYQGDVNKTAEKYYKQNKTPWGWDSVMGSNDFGHMYIKEMIENSEHFTDATGDENFYDKEFFDSIDFNKKTISTTLKKVKEYFDTRSEDLDKKYKELAMIDDVEELKERFASIKLVFFLNDSASRMTEELKTVLTNKEKSYLEGGFNYRVGIKTPDFKFGVEGFKYLN
jgi:hypothetical protein